ncbi:MAG: hypothetical protein HOP17_02905 [Acidobacteria bacterium]|nr:hypothetical protein [Acidobacteriota bacterium]
MSVLQNVYLDRGLCKLSAAFVVVMALCVSAVSACACTHHRETRVAEQPSCHSSPHEGMTMSSDERPLFDIVDSNCSCFVDTPAPAIIVKSDNKKAALEKIHSSSQVWIADVEPAPFENAEAASLFRGDLLACGDTLLVSGPSRAPPRL